MKKYLINVLKKESLKIKSRANKANKLLNNIWNNTKLNLNKVILFEMIYKIIVTIVFTPMIYFVLKVAIMGMGFFNLTNNELVNLGLRVPGIIAIILIIILSFLAIFIEIGVLTYIANKSYEKESVTLTESIINTLKVIPSTIGIYIIPLLFLCMIMGPIGGVGLSSSLIKNLSIPLFIKLELFKTVQGQLLLGGVIIFSIFLSIRWILSIPIIIIEKSTLKDAFRKSSNIYKNKKAKIIKFLVFWIVLNFIFKIIPISLYRNLGGLIVTNSITKNIYLSIFIIAFTLVSIVTLPIFITFLVELYYECIDYKVTKRDSQYKYYLSNSKTYLYINSNKKKLTVFTILFFIAITFYTSFSVIYSTRGDKNIAITAHRGYSKIYPENSISAIEGAAESNADYAEIDVMTTVNNDVVLFHDTTLKRFDNSNRKIKDMNLEEIKSVDIGSYFSSDFKDERIPTLEEVFKKFKGKIKFNIELKPQSKNDVLYKEVAKLIKEYDMEDDVVVSSLDFDNIKKFKSENLDAKVGYIFSFGVGDFTKIDADFISVQYGLLSRDLIKSMHKLGKEVHVWTLNDADIIVNSALLGVDNIITDDVWGTTAILLDLGLRDFEDLTESNDLSPIYPNINYEWLFYYNLQYLLKYVNI